MGTFATCYSGIRFKNLVAEWFLSIFSIIQGCIAPVICMQLNPQKYAY